MTQLSENETSQIKSLILKFQQIWNQKDSEGLRAVFTKDAEFTDITGQIAITPDRIVRVHETGFGGRLKNATLTFSDLYLRPVDENIVMATGKWSSTGHVNPAGETLAPRIGLMQLICKKDGQEWKISLVFNTDLSRQYVSAEDYQLKFYA